MGERVVLKFKAQYNLLIISHLPKIFSSILFIESEKELSIDFSPKTKLLIILKFFGSFQLTYLIDLLKEIFS